jgi:uncharacterized protein DUF742
MNKETWFDDPLVRPYAVTGGRTRSSTLELDLITLVVALRTPAEVDLQPEYERALEVCQQPMSVVEVAALVDLPLQVVKVVLSDLITQGLVIYRSAEHTTTEPSPYVLQAVLDGIRRL